MDVLETKLVVTRTKEIKANMVISCSTATSKAIEVYYDATCIRTYFVSNANRIYSTEGRN